MSLYHNVYSQICRKDTSGLLDLTNILKYHQCLESLIEYRCDGKTIKDHLLEWDNDEVLKMFNIEKPMYVNHDSFYSENFIFDMCNELYKYICMKNYDHVKEYLDKMIKFDNKYRSNVYKEYINELFDGFHLVTHVVRNIPNHANEICSILIKLGSEFNPNMLSCDIEQSYPHLQYIRYTGDYVSANGWFLSHTPSEDKILFRSLRDIFNHNVFHYYAMNSNYHTIDWEIVKENIHYIHLVDNSGKTPLHYFAENGVCIPFGFADIDYTVRDIGGNRPVDMFPDIFLSMETLYFDYQHAQQKIVELEKKLEGVKLILQQ